MSQTTPFDYEQRALSQGSFTRVRVFHVSICVSSQFFLAMVLWGPALLATLLAAPQPQKAVFLALTVLNVSIFGWIYFSQRGL